MNTIITCLESPAAERLGWVLVHSLWQLALLAGIYLLVRRLLWRAPPATRYLAACAIMVCMVLVLPLTALLVNTRPPPAGVASAVTVLPATPAPDDRAITEFQGPVPAPSTAVPDVPMVRADPAPPSKPMVHAENAASWKERLSERLVPALPWIVMTWFVGVLALAVRQLGGWILLRRLCGSGTEPVDEILAGKLTAMAKRLGVQRVVRLLSSVHVAVPSLIGHFKPVILFPASLISGLSPQQIEAILAHELAHIRRHDYLINLVQVTCETVLFYHPALWWISREIRREREHCCDDLAVRVCGDRVAYARTLAMLEERRAPLPAAAMAATGGSLLQRIRRIVGQPAAARTTRGTWLAGALVILTVCVILPLSIATSHAVGKAAKPEFAKAVVEILIDAQGRPLTGKPAAITLTNAAEIGELAAFFPRVGNGRKSGRAAGWKAGVTIDFLTSEGRTVKVSVSGNDNLTIWSEGQGDWPVKGDFKAHVEKLRKRPLKHSIGIHLVTDVPKDVPRDKAPLADLTLADEALITQDDIYQYDWESHTIRLKTQAAADRIVYPKEPDGRWVVGRSFVVVVDGQRIYRGAMLSGMSSIIPDEPMIHIGPGAGQWQPEFAVRIYPPTRGAPDPRGNASLKKALQDLLLMPKDGNLKVVLPSGVEIELVAVSDYPDKNAPWWRPDGTKLDAPPIDPADLDVTSYVDPNMRKIELVFRLSGKANPPAYESQIRGTDDRGVWWAGRRTRDGKRAVNDLKVVATMVPADAKTLEIDLLVAAGPWETVATSDGKQAEGPLGAAAPGDPAGGSGPSTAIAARFDPEKLDAQVIALDVDGGKHVVRGFDIRRGANDAGADFRFQGLTPGQFKSFTLQTRPNNERLRLTDVSLVPGQPTDAKLTAQPAAPALQQDRDFSSIPKKSVWSVGVPVVDSYVDKMPNSAYLIMLESTRAPEAVEPTRVAVDLRDFVPGISPEQIADKVGRGNAYVSPDWRLVGVRSTVVAPLRLPKPALAGSEREHPFVLALRRTTRQDIATQIRDYQVRHGQENHAGVAFAKNGIYALLTPGGKLFVVQYSGPNTWDGYRKEADLLFQYAGRLQIEPTTPPAGEPWGEAVEGVQVRLRADQIQWKAGEVPKLLTDFRNTGQAKLSLALAPEWWELELDGQWCRVTVTNLGEVEVKPFGPQTAHENISLPLEDRWGWKSKEGNKPLAFGPGKHTVRAAFAVQPAKTGEGKPVRAGSNPVEIEILPADAKPAGALTEAACQAMERAVAELGVSWLVARLAIEDGKLAEADRLMGEWIRALPRLRPVFPQGLQTDLDEAARDGGKLQAVLEGSDTAKASAMADAMDVAAGGQWRIEDAVARATLGFRTNVLKRMASALKEYEQLHNGNWPADPRSLRLDGEGVVDEAVAGAISYRHAPGDKGVRWSLPDRGGLDLYAGAGISHDPWEDPYLLGGKPGPELLAAARYDNPRHLSRTLSEKHCLDYLSKEKDSISRARVYYWLGTRFSHRRDEKAGENPDRQRANRYLAAVLDEQPQGISLPTLWSRSSLASMVDGHDQRINRSLECYDYFRSLDRTTIDRLKWPGENLDDLVRLVESSRDSEAYNIVTSAAAEKAVKTLAELVRRYPGEVIAKEAARQLQRIGKGTAESPADREAATRASLAEKAAKPALAFRGLDLSSAPVATKRSDIPDLWDAESGQLRKGVEHTRPFGPNLSMAVYYRPDKNVFYMLVNNGLSGSSINTEKYYGPFTGDPHQTLDLRPPLPEPAAGSPRPKLAFRDLDLTDAPMTTDIHKLPDVYDQTIPGFGASVTYSPWLLEQGYWIQIFYVADKDVFYVNCDSVWSRTEHFYGPFKGDPFKRFGMEAAVSKPVEFSVEELDPDLSGVWTGGNNEADVRLAFNGIEDAELRLRRHDVSMTVAASLKRVKEDATGTLGLRLDYKRHDREVRSAIIARVDRDKAGALFVTILPIAAQIDPDWREVKKLPIHRAPEGADTAPGTDEAAFAREMALAEAAGNGPPKIAHLRKALQLASGGADRFRAEYELAVAIRGAVTDPERQKSEMAEATAMLLRFAARKDVMDYYNRYGANSPHDPELMIPTAAVMAAAEVNDPAEGKRLYLLALNWLKQIHERRVQKWQAEPKPPEPGPGFDGEMERSKWQGRVHAWEQRQPRAKEGKVLSPSETSLIPVAIRGYLEWHEPAQRSAARERIAKEFAGTEIATALDATATPAAAEAPWGEPTEGVQVRLRADKVQWQAGEIPTLATDARNQGSLRLRGSPLLDYHLQIDGQRFHRQIMTASPQSLEFGPGKEFPDTRIRLLGRELIDPTTHKYMEELKPGKHTVRALIFVAHVDTTSPGKSVRAVSNPIEIDILPAAPSEIAWGEAVDGLQAGLLVDSDRRSVRLGETMTVSYVVRNVADKSINLQYGRQYGLREIPAPYGLRALDSRGKPVYCHFTALLGGAQMQEVALEPGKSLTLGSNKLTFWPLALDRAPEPGTLFVEPGKLTLSRTDTSTQSYSPGGIRSPGGLTSGRLEIEVLPARPGDPIAKALASQAAPAYKASTADIAAALSVMGGYVQTSQKPVPGDGGFVLSIDPALQTQCKSLTEGALNFLGHVATSHSEELTRRIAVELLGASGRANAVEPLFKALSDGSTAVRGAAARALETFRTPEVIKRVLQVLHEDKDAGVRACAAFALGHLGSRTVTADLLEALKSEKDPHAMEAVFAALSWPKDPSVIPALQKLKAARANAKFAELVDHTIRNINNPDYVFERVRDGEGTPPAQPADGPDTGDYDEAEGAAWSSQPNTPSGEIHLWTIRSCKRCWSVQLIEVLEAPGMAFQNFGQRIVGKEWKWKYRTVPHPPCH